jgi:hypothetical protein
VQVHDIFSQSTIAKLCLHIHGPAVQDNSLPDIIDF